MGEGSKIEWTDHTLNPWIGCEKISPGCKNCYAAVSTPVRVHRARGLELWGAGQHRHETKGWEAMARRWDREAAREGVRRRVFCLSIGDVFEKHPTLIEPRRRLLNLIPTTTHLDWLLLTKRPENAWGLGEVWNGSHIWPDNVWLGTTCENQEEAERRIPHLATIPAKVKFLSCEPLLGPLNLFGPALNDTGPFGSAWTKRCVQYSTDYGTGTEYDVELTQAVDWVIVGSESGPGARPMDISWARSLVEQCRDAKVPCFVKQIANEHDKKGGDPKHWPPGPGGRPWPREFPS